MKAVITSLEVDLEDKKRMKGKVGLEVDISDVDYWKYVWSKKNEVDISVSLLLKPKNGRKAENRGLDTKQAYKLKFINLVSVSDFLFYF